MEQKNNEPVGMLLSLKTYAKSKLLRGKTARHQLVETLRETTKIRYRLPVLNYLVLPESVNILVVPDSLKSVANLVGYLRGNTSLEQIRKTGQEGPFWKGRGTYTLVHGTTALQRCIEVLTWEPVQLGLVRHPCLYDWTGYRELVGLRQRYRVLDPALLCQIYASETNLHGNIAESIESRKCGDQPLAEWETVFIAGEKSWIDAASEHLPIRHRDITRVGNADSKEVYALSAPVNRRRDYLCKLIKTMGVRIKQKS